MREAVDYYRPGIFNRALLVFAALVALLCPGRRLQAEIIRSFTSEIHLQKDTTLDVNETIVMDFESAERHGIYRDMPVRYERYGNPYSVFVNVVTVTDENGNPLHYTLSQQGRELHIRIGDPDQKVSGINIYKLHYRVRRAVSFFDQSPEVYWNATGDQWPFAMEKVTARLYLPEGVTPGQMRTDSFVGPPGSTERGEARMLPANGVEFSAPAGLGAGEGLTFVVGLWPGAVDRPGMIQSIKWWLTDWWPAVVIPLAAFLVMFALWRETGRDEGSGGAIAVEWNPPEDLSPAEVGTLIDESCDMADVVSTLVDLAARGHLTIKAIKTDKLLFMSRRDYCFTRNAPPPNDALEPHEALFLKGVFQLSGKNKVFLSELKGTFYSYLPGIRNSIYDSLMGKKYFKHRPDRVRALYTAWGVVLMVVGGVLTYIGYAVGHVAVGIGVLAAGGVLAAFAKAMPAKTQMGSKAARECQGFRRFLVMVEKERIARMAQEDPTIFGRLLPYAMVLGVADQWAHAFEGLMTQPPDWYTSSDGATFSTIWFVHDLGSGMHSMGQTFVSRPESQSSGWSGGGGGGFSGFSGGFSGGGFGGGGGGSW